MKKIQLFLYLFCFCWSDQMQAQFKLNFSVGNAAPLHELSSVRLSPADINTYSGSISYVPKKIGASVQFMNCEYETNQDFINQFQSFNPFYSSKRNNWISNFLFIGPVLKLGKEKLNVELFPKIGIGFIKGANREVSYLSPNGLQHLLYSDNHTETNLEGSSLFSGLDLRLNVGITKNIEFALEGGLNTNRFSGSGNSTIYREVSSNGQITEEELIAGRLLRLDCESYDLIHLSAGISLKLSKKKKGKEPKPEGKTMLPPKPVFPEDRSKISMTKADSLVLEWIKETPNVDKANYQFYLYKKQEDDAKDSLVFNTKVIRGTELELPQEIRLQAGSTYRWSIQAVDDKNLKPCPDACNSIIYEFEVVPLAIPQYYQLSPKNAGNHVLVQDRLRFVLDQTILMPDDVKLEIFDDRQALALAFENLNEPTGLIEYQGLDRYEINIRELKSDGYYYLKVDNGKRTYYLRFYKNEIQKDEKRK